MTSIDSDKLQEYIKIKKYEPFRGNMMCRCWQCGLVIFGGYLLADDDGHTIEDSEVCHGCMEDPAKRKERTRYRSESFNNWRATSARNKVHEIGINMGQATDNQIYWWLLREGYYYAPQRREWLFDNGLRESLKDKKLRTLVETASTALSDAIKESGLTAEDGPFKMVVTWHADHVSFEVVPDSEIEGE